MNKLWYAVMRDYEDTDWGTGSFDLEEAKEMARMEESDDAYVVAIDGEYNDDGDPTTDPVAVWELHGDELLPEVQDQIDKRLSVLVVEPEKAPELRQIEPGSDSLQKLVGGNIEAVYPFEDPVCIICNDTSKEIGLPLNRALYADGKMYGILAGTFLVTGLNDVDFTSLSPELAAKYMAHYNSPEFFFRVNGKISSVKAQNEDEAVQKFLGVLSDSPQAAPTEAPQQAPTGPKLSL